MDEELKRKLDITPELDKKLKEKRSCQPKHSKGKIPIPNYQIEENLSEKESNEVDRQIEESPTKEEPEVVAEKISEVQILRTELEELKSKMIVPVKEDKKEVSVKIRNVVFIFLFIALLGWIFYHFFYISYIPTTTKAGRVVLPQPLTAPPPVVMKEEYNQIRQGMTYDQVVSIIGAQGDEQVRNNMAGFETVMYSWMNYNGSNMNAMFQNGKLIQKAQFGLP